MFKLIAATLVVASATVLAGGLAKTELKPSEVKFAKPFEEVGPAIGIVEGKFGDKNPVSFYVKFPAGGDSGWHIHSEDYQGIVIDGRFTEQQATDKTEKVLEPGMYFVQPAKDVHRNGCLKGKDCLVWVHFPHGADSIPTTIDGKPVAIKK